MSAHDDCRFVRVADHAHDPEKSGYRLTKANIFENCSRAHARAPFKLLSLAKVCGAADGLCGHGATP